MQNAMTAQLAELVKLRRETPADVIAEAVEVGMSRLYLESVLKRYLNRHIPRNKAVQLVGREAVELAERQRNITQKDVAWGLGLGKG